MTVRRQQPLTDLDLLGTGAGGRSVDASIGALDDLLVAQAGLAEVAVLYGQRGHAHAFRVEEYSMQSNG